MQIGNPFTKHVATSPDIKARLVDYGFSSLAEGLRAAFPRYVKAVKAALQKPEEKQPESFGIVVRQIPSTERIKAGHSTGYFLVWIVRRHPRTGDYKFVSCLNADNPTTLDVDELYGY